MAAGSGQPNTTDIEVGRARRFFRSLARKPFVTVIYGEDGIQLYLKGVTREEALHAIEQAIDELES